MTRIPALAALCLLLAAPAHAEGAPVFAEYWTNNGSLPPEYAWETTVTILSDGTLTLIRCPGYDRDGDACKTRRAVVPEAALADIRRAAEASGLSETPAREAEMPLVGGSASGGRVWLDGAELKLLSQPELADAGRVGMVLESLRAAIPIRFERYLRD